MSIERDIIKEVASKTLMGDIEFSKAMGVVIKKSLIKTAEGIDSFEYLNRADIQPIVEDLIKNDRQVRAKIKSVIKNRILDSVDNVIDFSDILQDVDWSSIDAIFKELMSGLLLSSLESGLEKFQNKPMKKK